MGLPTSEPNSDTFEGLEALEAQLRECYGRVAYSHKTHEKCADIYQDRLKTFKNIQITLSVITTGGLIVSLFGQNPVSTKLAAITSTILLGVTAYSKENDLGQLAQKHTQVAGDLWNIRESYLSLLTDIADKNVSITKIREKRDQLQVDLKKVYEVAPRTMKKAYEQAQEALKLNEELTFSDEEIDNMLPSSLRSKKSR